MSQPPAGSDTTLPWGATTDIPLPLPTCNPLVAQSTPLTPSKGHPDWHPPRNQTPGTRARSWLPGGCWSIAAPAGLWQGEPQHPKTHPPLPTGLFPRPGGGDMHVAGRDAPHCLARLLPA